MQLNIANHEYTVIENGIYYFALPEYPEISAGELRSILEFIAYEKKYGRETEIVCDDAALLTKVTDAIAAPDSIEAVEAYDRYVYHATSLGSAKKILASGRLLSAVNVYEKTAEQLAYEKKDSLWNDPADYFEYIMFGWGNDPVGDYVVMSEVETDDMEEEFKTGKHTGVRFYFRYADLEKHPGQIADGYHAIKVKDEIVLKDYLFACVVPEQFKDEVLPCVPEALREKIVFLPQEELGIWDWSVKVYDCICGMEK